MNLNLSGSLNAFRLIVKPSLCLPHATVSTFADLPIPLSKAFEGKGKGAADIKAVVLDKDDCFAYPDSNQIHPPYLDRFRELQKEFPGRRLLIVSNTAGASSYDKDGKLANQVEMNTGVSVLIHKVKKPGCGDEIMSYFKGDPETGVTHPSQVVVIGDRLSTDMMLANRMGSWGLWIKQGVKPMDQKSVLVKSEHRLEDFLRSWNCQSTTPKSPFE